MNISYRALANHFRLETGMSIIDKLTEIRINKAKHLLLTAEYTLMQIAELTGFGDESYFSKKFKKYVCCSPKEYRK